VPLPSSIIGCVGRVTSTGAIRPGRTGEVLLEIGGGTSAYMARDADGRGIEAGEEVAVVDLVAPRTVLVTRLYDHPPASSKESRSP
jgi:hypothetical protein